MFFIILNLCNPNMWIIIGACSQLEVFWINAANYYTAFYYFEIVRTNEIGNE